MINLNRVAKDITTYEGKKVNLSIAQVKEVLRLVLLYLQDVTLEELTELLHRVK